MAESTVLLDLVSLQPSAKRPRPNGWGDPERPQPSAIQDPRITFSSGTKFRSGVITILVGGGGDDSVSVVEETSDPDITQPLEDTQPFSGNEKGNSGAQPFQVHEDIISKRSPFIANALKSHWAALRPDPRTIQLPETDSDTFDLYLNHVYTGRLPVNAEPSTRKSAHYPLLSRAYVLGEFLMDVEFQNAVADAIVLYARGADGPRIYPSHEDITIIYEGTRPASPLRKLLVDIWCLRGKPEWLENETASNYPNDFLMDVTKEFMITNKTASDPKPRPWKYNHLQYHISDDANPPSKTNNALPSSTPV